MPSAGLLHGAHDLVLNNPHLNDNSTNVSVHHTIAGRKRLAGLKILLRASMPDAFYDSSARDPPPSCHPDTRRKFIDKIIRWGLGTSQHNEPMLWMHGPAGVGKSAIAQTCSERLAEKGRLGAALFFSRSVGPNKRDDPRRLFPSLAYQIATKSKPFGDILDKRIRDDPTLVKKSMREQFRELLVKPLSRLQSGAAGAVEGLVIVIDGLDECGKGPGTHCDIIKIIATPIRYQTTPFLWAFFSRPETHIIGSFTTNGMRLLSYHLKIRVSRKIDNEITLYLTNGLQKIQRRNGLPDWWVSKRDIGVLVNLSGGLFIYAATIIRFVGSHESLGPVDQLRAILMLASDNKGTDSVHPLSELDLFYTLIMRRVPPGILPRILAILLFVTLIKRDELVSESHIKLTLTPWIANMMGLSELQCRNACGSLHSVLKLDSSLGIKFYHASFMDFLLDPSRSGEFCIFLRLDSLRLELLQRSKDVHSRSIGGSTVATSSSPDVHYSTQGSPENPIHFDITWPIIGCNNITFYRLLVDVFFAFCQWDGHPLDSLTSEALLDFQFRAIHFLSPDPSFFPDELCPPSLKKSLHADFRNQIVRRTYNPIAYLHVPRNAWKDLYVLGCGKNKVLSWRDKKYDMWHVSPYPTWFKFR